MNVGPTYTHVLNEGYAAGVVGRSGEWLSVHSSPLSSRLVFPTQEGAELYRAAWRLWQAYTTEMQIPLT
ncbi:hypothetical protein [Nocardia asiatica]